MREWSLQSRGGPDQQEVKREPPTRSPAGREQRRDERALAHTEPIGDDQPWEIGAGVVTPAPEGSSNLPNVWLFSFHNHGRDHPEHAFCALRVGQYVAVEGPGAELTRLDQHVVALPR